MINNYQTKIDNYIHNQKMSRNKRRNNRKHQKNQKNQKYNVLMKILVCGDCKVGKSLLCQQLSNENNTGELNNALIPNYEPTIGIDMIVIKRKVDNLNTKIHLWDTSGDPRYRSIIRSYYRACCAAIIMVDLYDGDTLEILKEWIKDLKGQTRTDNRKLIINVFANTANGINPINVNNTISKFCDKENIIYSEIKLSIDYTVNNEYYVNENNYQTLTKAIDGLVKKIHDLYLSNNMNIDVGSHQKIQGITYGYEEKLYDNRNGNNTHNENTNELDKPLLDANNNQTKDKNKQNDCCCIL